VFRLRAQAFTVYTAVGDKADLACRFEGLGEGETGEVTVYYKAGNEYRPVRICARRKSREEERQGRERMEKTNRRKGTGEASARREAYNRYIIVAASLDSAD
jgi:hypothetical protein